MMEVQGVIWGYKYQTIKILCKELEKKEDYKLIKYMTIRMNKIKK